MHEHDKPKELPKEIVDLIAQESYQLVAHSYYLLRHYVDLWEFSSSWKDLDQSKQAIWSSLVKAQLDSYPLPIVDSNFAEHVDEFFPRLESFRGQLRLTSQFCLTIATLRRLFCAGVNPLPLLNTVTQKSARKEPVLQLSTSFTIRPSPPAIQLSWGYILQAGETIVIDRASNGADFSLIATVSSGTVTWLDEGVFAYNNYQYRLTCSNPAISRELIAVSFPKAAQLDPNIHYGESCRDFMPVSTKPPPLRPQLIREGHVAERRTI